MLLLYSLLLVSFNIDRFGQTFEIEWSAPSCFFAVGAILTFYLISAVFEQ